MKPGQGRGERPGRSLRMAMAQIEPVLGDVEANVAMHLRIARDAARRGARLLVFPELSLTGYRLQDLVPEVAVTLADPGPLRPLLEASRRIPMVVGMVEESEGHRYYNSGLYLEGGRIRHVHRKVYLPTYGMFEEGRYFAAGDALRSFRARAGRFGILICEDLWHASSALVLAQDGADYLLVISNSPTRGIDTGEVPASQSIWMDLLKVTARLQTVYVVWVNRVGFEDGIHFGGGSCVIDPYGRMTGGAGPVESALLMCELDRGVLRRARTSYPLLRDERLPVLEREVRRLLERPATARHPGAP